MPKFIARMECFVEVVVEADSMDEVAERVTDLNFNELNNLPKIIAEIYDVLEVEQIA